MKAARIVALAVGISLILLPGEASAARRVRTDVLFGALSSSSIELLMESGPFNIAKVRKKCQKDRQVLVTDNGAQAFAGLINGPSFTFGYLFESGVHELVFSADAKSVRYKGTRYTCKAASVSESISL